MANIYTIGYKELKVCHKYGLDQEWLSQRGGLFERFYFVQCTLNLSFEGTTLLEDLRLLQYWVFTLYNEKTPLTLSRYELYIY